MVEIFEAIYEGGNWGQGSGPGSMPEGLAPYCAFLEKQLREKRPASVLDLGCGYFAPYLNLDWQNADYLGVDVARQCIGENSKYAGAKRGRRADAALKFARSQGETYDINSYMPGFSNNRCTFTGCGYQTTSGTWTRPGYADLSYAEKDGSNADSNITFLGNIEVWDTRSPHS